MFKDNEIYKEILGALVLFLFALGWMDTLSLFGVENSKEYTWWYLIYYLGNL